jgi:uncharacterized DUF497 family protein
MATWDESKRRINLAKHGVDFAILERFDWSTASLREDETESYGERREVATGFIELTL